MKPAWIPAFIASVAIAAAFAANGSQPRTLVVRVEPAGCKPSPPVALEIEVAPRGAGRARIVATATPRFDAEAVEIDFEPGTGAVLGAADPPAAGAARAGGSVSRSATVALVRGAPGARLRVSVRVRFHPPDDPAALESVGLLRDVVLGEPQAENPGPLLRVGGEMTVDVPSVTLR